MGGEGEVEGSVYDMMTSWLTPPFLFLFVNLIIGTIAITSRFTTPRKRKLDSPDQLVRSPSLLDRVTSFGLGCYKHELVTTFVETQTVVEPVQNQEPVHLDRAPSLSSLLKRVKSLTKIEEVPSQDPDDATRKQLTRTPSLLERLKFIKFHRTESVKMENKEPEPESEPNSESEPEILDGGDLVEEEVDAKADDFIKRFKQQLRLQRLDSIIRCRNMLQRNWEQ